jgi:hypothetical protein
VNENEGMGNVPVFMLKQQRLAQYPISNYGVIYAATHGRGIFQSVDFVGMDDFDESGAAVLKSISLYPNPVRDEMRITYHLDRQAGVSLEIYDINGQKVMDVMQSSQVAAGEHLLPCDISDLNSGTYILIFKSGGLIKSSKFIIMR